MSDNPVKQKTHAIRFAQRDFILDGAGALYWPAHQILIVSDIHLEKGSYFASRGQPLPVYDTLDTLNRIEALIASYEPRHVIALGDNMHDANALQRIVPGDLAQLFRVCNSVQHWSWIIGNHDKDDYSLSVLRDMNFYSQLAVENVIFSHDYTADAPYQVIGHYHPKITVKTKIQAISGKCFIITDKKILMPAFGSYTGGLDVNNDAIKPLVSAEHPRYFLLQQNKIWRVK